jgi:hypothetical protein
MPSLPLPGLELPINDDDDDDDKFIIRQILS